MGGTWSVVAGCVALLGASVWSDGAEAPQEPRPGQVRLRDGFAAAAVRRGVVDARRRLAHADCQRLLREFTDASGRTLQEALEHRGRTPQEHLDDLFFYDGRSQPACGRASVMAVTTPGSHVVLICAPAFAKASARNHRAAEYNVIHELLHTLGLGENPPSPSEINARVARACRQ